MDVAQAWIELRDALDFAVSRVVDDDATLDEREAADGHRYIVRILAAVSESALLTFDPAAPSFLPMLDAVRHLGASGPDIDYDVAIVEPGVAHRITGARGGASYVGISIYAYAGAEGASGIVGSVDVDDLAGPDGTFTYEFRHPEAARVIVRQYFHDRAAQPRGRWTIERLDGTPRPTVALPTTAGTAGRLLQAAQALRWNAQLNQLWSPELRATPNAFVRQPPDAIVAAVTNPDVVYAFSWWRIDEGQALAIDLDPPDTPYWALQVCDRWFQSYPRPADQPERPSRGPGDRRFGPDRDRRRRPRPSQLARHERAPHGRDVLPLAARRPGATAGVPAGAPLGGPVTSQVKATAARTSPPTPTIEATLAVTSFGRSECTSLRRSAISALSSPRSSTTSALVASSAQPTGGRCAIRIAAGAGPSECSSAL